MDVIARMSEIRARFGVEDLAVRRAPSTADFSRVAEVEDLPTVAAASGGLSVDDLLQSLEVQRSDLTVLSDRPSTTMQHPIPGAPMSSDFGTRTDPFTGESRMHRGMDISAPAGTPIQASAGGTVTWAGERGTYGNLVVVDHGKGVETRYAHQAWVDVQVGDVVRAGDVLGAVGSTGRSTGPHLHFELRVAGEAVDPEPWLAAL